MTMFNSEAAKYWANTLKGQKRIEQPKATIILNEVCPGMGIEMTKGRQFFILNPNGSRLCGPGTLIEVLRHYLESISIREDKSPRLDDLREKKEKTEAVIAGVIDRLNEKTGLSWTPVVENNEVRLTARLI